MLLLLLLQPLLLSTSQHLQMSRLRSKASFCLCDETGCKFLPAVSRHSLICTASASNETGVGHTLFNLACLIRPCFLGATWRGPGFVLAFAPLKDISFSFFHPRSLFSFFGFSPSSSPFQAKLSKRVSPKIARRIPRTRPNVPFRRRRTRLTLLQKSLSHIEKCEWYLVRFRVLPAALDSSVELLFENRLFHLLRGGRRKILID